MRVQHNIMAMNAYRNYNNNSKALSGNLEKLSSGYKINRAGDDAAGLAISEKMRAQITGLEAAQKNVKDGISLVKTAEGAMQEIHDMLNRMDYLATQSANGTYQNEVDRENLNKEVTALKTEIDRIADSANFNGIKLLDGSLAGGASGGSTATSLLGSNVSKFSAAELDVSGLNKKLTSIDVATTGKEYYSIDGQTLTLDMATGVGKEIAALLDKNLSANTTDDDKLLAANLTEKFNQAIKEAGLKGEVKISSRGTAGNFKIESLNEGAESSFSFLGVEKALSSIAKSVGANLFRDSSGDAATKPVEVVATQRYDGTALVTSEAFQMVLNGQTLDIKLTGAIKNSITGDGHKGALMSTVAATLQGLVQGAVSTYNKNLGLQAGVKDEQSGLTGLTKADFKVEADSSGGFKVTYTGDQKVSFKFQDVGDKDVAARLGLSSSTSSGGGAGGLTLQIGDTADSFNQMRVNVGDMHTAALGIAGIDISDQDGAAEAIQTIKDAINSVSSVRGDLGAIQNRLDHTANNLSVMEENIQDAESTIRDTDVADEMMSYVKNNILLQSAQAMLAQANQVPQGVLQLLG